MEKVTHYAAHSASGCNTCISAVATVFDDADAFKLLAGIGGCNDGPGLMTLQRKGELVPMLKSAGAL